MLNVLIGIALLSAGGLIGVVVTWYMTRNIINELESEIEAHQSDEKCIVTVEWGNAPQEDYFKPF